jgi:diacylglycerol kinase family enzyme
VVGNAAGRAVSSPVVAFPSAPSLERLADLEALVRPARAKRMLVLVNPHATTMSERLRHLVVAALEGRYEVDSVATQRRGHAIELCREAAGEGYDVVVAFGGDGTANEAANGLAGSGTPLTCLPGGATNVYCRMLGIPLDVVDATEHLLALADRWAPTAVDLGRVNDRWFTFAAGAGLDASVVERVDRHPALKARFGPWFFAESAIATFLSRYVGDPLHLEVALEGRTLRGVSVFVQNGPAYTYFNARPIVLAAEGGLTSSSLAGAVLERANPVDLPTIAFRALSPSAPLAGHARVRAFADARALHVRSADGRPVPFQVDGDHLGEADALRFGVTPGALRVVR